MTGEQLKEFFLTDRAISARLTDTAPNTWTAFERIKSIVYTKDAHGRVIVSAELIDSAGCLARVRSSNIRPLQED